jgi:hypothetical protein
MQGMTSEAIFSRNRKCFIDGFGGTRAWLCDEAAVCGVRVDQNVSDAFRVKIARENISINQRGRSAQSLSPKAEVLIVALHIEPPLLEFRKLPGGYRVDLHCSEPVFIWGDNRGLIVKLRFQWVDPVVTMLRMEFARWGGGMGVSY